MKISLLKEHLYEGRRRLKAASIPGGALDAEVLLQAALGQSREYVHLHPLDTVSQEDSEIYFSLIEGRINRKPVAKLIGSKEFYSREFFVSEAVLDPRPDSELLIDAALAYVHASNIKSVSLKVADFGLGSGCLLITLLKELPYAQGIGIEQSSAALSVAKRNIILHDLLDRCVVLEQSWEEVDLAFTMDIILSNPPYIGIKERDTLAPEVLRYEPSEALFAGEDGLDAYQTLSPVIKRSLAPSGRAFIEIGYRQKDAVTDILERCKLKVIACELDLQGHDRCLVVVHA